MVCFCKSSTLNALKRSADYHLFQFCFGAGKRDRGEREGRRGKRCEEGGGKRRLGGESEGERGMESGEGAETKIRERV